MLTGAAVLGFPLLNVVYWSAMQSDRRLPVDGDSISIPIFFGTVLAVLAAPFVAAFTWACLRGLEPGTTLLAWRRDQPVLSAAATAVFGGAALLCAGAALFDLRPGRDWYDYIWPGYALLLAWWLLALRAALIGAPHPAG